MIYTWVSEVPPGRAVDGSSGFGGPHAKARPRPTDPDNYVTLMTNIDFVRRALESDKIPHAGDDEISLNIPEEQALKYVRERFPKREKHHVRKK